MVLISKIEGTVVIWMLKAKNFQKKIKFLIEVQENLTESKWLIGLWTDSPESKLSPCLLTMFGFLGCQSSCQNCMSDTFYTAFPIV